MENITKDNKTLKNDLANKDLVIKELQNKMNDFIKEFKNINKINLNNEENKSSERNEDDDAFNISLGDNLNINVENIKNKNILINNDSNKTKPSSKLNLNIGKNKDFNEEFLENYDKFSPSWRREADRMMQRKGNKK
jgi:hypothetical protein